MFYLVSSVATYVSLTFLRLRIIHQDKHFDVNIFANWY